MESAGNKGGFVETGLVGWTAAEDCLVLAWREVDECIRCRLFLILRRRFLPMVEVRTSDCRKTSLLGLEPAEGKVTQMLLVLRISLSSKPSRFDLKSDV